MFTRYDLWHNLSTNAEQSTLSFNTSQLYFKKGVRPLPVSICQGCGAPCLKSHLYLIVVDVRAQRIRIVFTASSMSL